MDSISLFSPAKLNLFFRVLHKRNDGFHEIASLFQAISLGDELKIELSDRDELICDDPCIPLDDSNLIFKSLDVFRKNTQKHFPVRFHLKKQIPIEAGLGGGSSNAATAIWGLNQLAGTSTTDTELAKWVSHFSSDAPFFFSKGTAYCTGKGENIKNIESKNRESLWIAKPSGGLKTPEVYKKCKPNEYKKIDPLQVVEDFINRKPRYFNDLEQPAFQLFPKLKDIKNQLLEIGFNTVMMTGSGTAFFCLGEPKVASSFTNLPDIRFFKVNYLFRELDTWYKTPSFC